MQSFGVTETVYGGGQEKSCMNHSKHAQNVMSQKFSCQQGT